MHLKLTCVEHNFEVHSSRDGQQKKLKIILENCKVYVYVVILSRANKTKKFNKFNNDR